MINNTLLLKRLNAKTGLAGFLLIFGYYFDEIINGIIGNNIAGSVVILLVAGFLLLEPRSKICISKSSAIGALVFATFGMLAFISPLGCHLESKGALSLLLVGFLFLSLSLTVPARIVLDQKLSALYLISVILALSLDYVGIGLLKLILGSSRDSGPYFEPSHLAFYILPFITFRILNNSRDYLSLLALFVSFVMVPSSTLTIGVIGLLLLIIMRKKLNTNDRVGLLTSIAIVIIIVLIFADIIDISQSIDRISSLSDGFLIDDRLGGSNLSSLVWLNGWSQALQTLNETMWLGVGFNQMGCGRFENMGVLSPIILEKVGIVLNFNDGSFLAAKLIAELGVLGLATVVGISIYSLRVIISMLRTNYLRGTLDNIFQVANAAGALCVLSYLFVRGSGYFQLPILVALSLLFLSRPKLSTKSNDETL